ncbi:hypothetical protein D3C77_430810 [compost metagenome]
MFRLPTQLIHDLGRINAITPVMSWAVFNKGNKRFRLTKLLQNSLNNLHVRPLIISANIINFTISTFMDH